MALFLRGLWFLFWIGLGIVAIVLFVKGIVLAGVFVGGAALCLLVLGEATLRNLFDALFTPSYSLRTMARDDSFAFSLLLTFLGGLVLGFYAQILNSFVNSSFASYAEHTIGDALMAYSNPVYKDVLFQDGVIRMKDTFDLIFTNNIVWLPVAWVAFWLVLGVLYWLGGRLFGSTTDLQVALGALAYWATLFAVIVGYFVIHGIGAGFSMAAGVSALGIVEMIGALLFLISLFYLFISISQGMEVTMVQAVVIFIIWLVVFGGAAVGLYIYKASPACGEFLQELQSTNPAG